MNSALALIGFGEAGQTFAAHAGWGNRAFAYDLKTDAADSRGAMWKTYERQGVSGSTSTAEALQNAKLVLSLVTADQALQAAEAASATLQPGSFFFDLNSVAPSTKRDAEKLIHDVGGHYIDAAIMAPVLPAAMDVPLLVSGEQAGTGAELLLQLGFTNVRSVGPEAGRASTIKMVRSVVVKGVEALTAECLLAAYAAGVVDEVLASLGEDWPKRADYNLDRMLVHGVRRAAEMREVVKTLKGLGVEPHMTLGTTMRQQALGELQPPSVPQTLDQKLTFIRSHSKADSR